MTIKKYAGFWLRIAAYISDAFIITFLSYLFWFLIESAATLFFGQLNLDSPFSNIEENISSIITLIIFILYFSLLESSKAQSTFGKQLVGIKVVNKNNKRISFNKALLRVLSKFFSIILFFAGYLMIAFTKKKQGLHDKITNTYVIRIENENKKNNFSYYGTRIGFVLFASSFLSLILQNFYSLIIIQVIMLIIICVFNLIVSFVNIENKQDNIFSIFNIIVSIIFLISTLMLIINLIYFSPPLEYYSYCSNFCNFETYYDDYDILFNEFTQNYHCYCYSINDVIISSTQIPNWV